MREAPRAGGRERLRPRPRAAVPLAIGVLAICAPLLASRVLPLHDASGIVGLGGALAHRSNPAARIDEFFRFDFGPYPSTLYFGWLALTSALGLPVEVGVSGFVAVFVLAAPVLATWLLVRTFDRPGWLALLALPVAWHHQVWFGFLGSAATVAAIVAAPALGWRVARAPAGRAGWRPHVALAAVVLVAAFAHPFGLALLLATLLPLPFWPSPQPEARGARARRIAWRLAALGPALVYLAPWAARFFSGSGGGGGTFRRALRQVTPRRWPSGRDLEVLVEWLGGGYAGRIDDAIVIVALASLVVLLVIGCKRGQQGAAEPSPTRWPRWLWPAWATAVLGATFLLLPDRFEWPQLWWGVRFRAVAPLFLVAIALVPMRRRGLGAWAVAPAYAAALGYAAFVTHDFATHFRDRVLAGFDAALAAIPPGRSVMGLPAPAPDTHYALAHPYLVQHYVARKGGRAAPYLRGHADAYWVVQQPVPVIPHWGDPHHFDFDAHAGGWDYFLLEVPPDGRAFDPFRSLEDDVRLVSDGPGWRLYQNTKPTPPRAMEELPPR